MFYTSTHSYCKSCYRAWRKNWRTTPRGRESEQRTRGKYVANLGVKARIAAYNKGYKAERAEELQVYYRSYNQSQRGKDRQGRYNRSEKGKAAQRRFRHSAKRKAYIAGLRASGKLAEYNQRYIRSDKGRVMLRRQNASEAAKARKRRYMHSEKGRAAAAAKMRRYRQSSEWICKDAARRKQYRQMDKAKQRVQRYGDMGKQAEWTRRYNQSPKRRETRRRYNQSPKGWEASQQASFRRRSALDQVRRTLSRLEWQEILTRYGHACFYCKAKGVKLTVDHVIPISKGGHHTKENVVPACQSCNSRKHDKILS